MTHQDVLEKILDSTNATVGGGSASALAGAMGAGLMGMVARLSIGKDYGYPAEEYERIASELDALVQELLAGSIADTEAFCGIKAAYQVPKEDRERRSAAIQAAGMKAADVPLANAACCRKVRDLGRRLSGKSNPNAASDVGIGLALAEIGIAGCLDNVKANLALIKDAAIRKDYEQRISGIEH